VRQIFRLPRIKAHEPLPALLARADRSLEPGQRCVLIVDGLDEAFGRDGRYAGVVLPGPYLPARPPDGVKIILTSRPGNDHLSWLADPTLCDWHNLDPGAADNLDDIADYLRRESDRRGLGLEGSLVAALRDRSEGCFMAAVQYLRDRPGLAAELDAWRADPCIIPRGLDGWLEGLWSRLTRPLTLHEEA
jgi:hypothetical protein